jgi:hypothetical protein
MSEKGEEENSMDDLFYKKVRAAATAGWWTLLVAVLLATVLWGAYLGISHWYRACMTAMCGGVSWETAKTVILWMIAVFKMVIWILFLAVVWLTIWSRKLRRVQ